MKKPHPMNETRANWALIALDAFCFAVMGERSFADCAGGDDDDAIGDLLCDLMHFCQQTGRDFDVLLDRGRAHFEYEAAPDYRGD